MGLSSETIALRPRGREIEKQEWGRVRVVDFHAGSAAFSHQPRGELEACSRSVLTDSSVRPPQRPMWWRTSLGISGGIESEMVAGLLRNRWRARSGTRKKRRLPTISGSPTRPPNDRVQPTTMQRALAQLPDAYRLGRFQVVDVVGIILAAGVRNEAAARVCRAWISSEVDSIFSVGEASNRPSLFRLDRMRLSVLALSIAPRHCRSKRTRPVFLERTKMAASAPDTAEACSRRAVMRRIRKQCGSPAKD